MGELVVFDNEKEKRLENTIGKMRDVKKHLILNLSGRQASNLEKEAGVEEPPDNFWKYTFMALEEDYPGGVPKCIPTHVDTCKHFLRIYEVAGIIAAIFGYLHFMPPVEDPPCLGPWSANFIRQGMERVTVKGVPLKGVYSYVNHLTNGKVRFFEANQFGAPNLRAPFYEGEFGDFDLNWNG